MASLDQTMNITVNITPEDRETINNLKTILHERHYVGSGIVAINKPYICGFCGANHARHAVYVVPYAGLHASIYVCQSCTESIERKIPN